MRKPSKTTGPPGSAAVHPPTEPAPFEQSRSNPFLRGLCAPTFDEMDVSDLKVVGEIPRGLSGVYMRNGSNQQMEPRGRYHLFDGDGMIHAVYLRDGKARYRNRWVMGTGMKRERREGKALYYGLGEMGLPPLDVLRRTGPFKNLANTAIIHHHGKFLALFEGGSPTEVSRELETLGKHRFGGQLTGPFTAHPRFDPEDGHMYAFGADPMPPYLTYYVISPEGEVLEAEVIPMEVPLMMHDFAITENHAVFFFSPAVYHAMEAMGGGMDPVVWEPERGTRIGVMPRDGGVDAMRYFEVPNCFAFHFVNAYESGDALVLEGASAEKLLSGLGIGDNYEGLPNFPTRWTMNLKTGQTRTEQFSDRGVEMCQIDLRRTGRKHRHAYFLHYEGSNKVTNWENLLRIDVETGAECLHVYGRGQVSSEVIHIPDPGSDREEDGYLVSYVFNPERDATDLVGLSAASPSDPPVFRVELPQRVPLGFHGSWTQDT